LHQNRKKLWAFGRRNPTEIIGVVANSCTTDLAQSAEPEIYLPYWQTGEFTKRLMVSATSDPNALMAVVQRELRAIDPTASIENLKTLEEIRDDSLASRRFAMRLLIGFALVASALTLVGIYGVLSLSVAARRRELAIRMALGAERRNLLMYVTRIALTRSVTERICVTTSGTVGEQTFHRDNYCPLRRQGPN
jgi:putative ABC transport system permease protein